MKRILVIKLGALGDFVQAFAPFAAIRAHYREAEITLLTSPAFATLSRESPWFDKVIDVERDAMRAFSARRDLKKRLSHFDLVIDLQTSSLSTRLYRLAGRPLWNGIVRKSPLFHTNPYRNAMHTLARQADQLQCLGITTPRDVDVSWLHGPIPSIDAPYAILVPGASLHRPAKKWPSANFARLAQMLRARGLHAVIVGSKIEEDLGGEIAMRCPGTVNLIGKTSLRELANLFAHATLAIGNDTGPMHLSALMGCKSVVLFSSESDPHLSAPVGRDSGQIVIVKTMNLANLTAEKVAEHLDRGH